MKAAKDPNFDTWSETWDGTQTLFALYWREGDLHGDDTPGSLTPDYVRENMTIAEIKTRVKAKGGDLK